MFKQLSLTFLLLSVLVSANSYAQNDIAEGLNSIGKIALVKGVATSKSQSGTLTTLAKNSPIYVSDVIETASRSFVVVKFNDGGKLTLRPESQFAINEYNDTKGQEKESFKLIKGGLRAVTGAIGKAKPKNVTYSARNTTIGIRGTTFVVKLCKEGTSGCAFRQNAEDQANSAESSEENAEIFLIDKKSGGKKKIDRKKLQSILDGVYISVIDGAISIDTPNSTINISAGDKCMAGGSVECFTPGVGIEDKDVFLGEDAEDITLFNLFDGGEDQVNSKICEID